MNNFKIPTVIVISTYDLLFTTIYLHIAYIGRGSNSTGL